MIVWPARFNIYLACLALGLALAAPGCRSPERQRAKQLAVLRVHVEVAPNTPGPSERISVLRSNPTRVSVAPSPFLTEAEVAEATVVEDALGGHALQLKFNQRGAWLLEQHSALNLGRRFVIYAEFGLKPVEARWLAAPLVLRRVADGTLVFTPDATRAEADEIALGLNNVAIKVGNQSKPKKSKSREK